MSLIEKFSPDLFFTLDKDKIIITLDDLKNIPELQKYISLKQVILNGKIKLIDLTYENQNQVIIIFLKNYNFIQSFGNEDYFNYTKLKKLWPNNALLDQLFDIKQADLRIEINNETNYFFLFNKLSPEQINYIGLLFFSGFSKVEDSKEYVVKQYEYFTDVNFGPIDFNMITDFKQFFIDQFLTFINTNYQSVFCSNAFGSNLKHYIQTKKLSSYYEKITSDITGFINDFALLYKQTIELINFKIDSESEFYTVKITLIVKINEENVKFTFVKEY